MIKSKLARAGATILPVALLALIGTTSNTDKIHTISNQHQKHQVCNHVHSDAATAETAAAASQGKNELLAQRPYRGYNSGSASDYLDDCSQEGIYHWPAERLPIKVYMEDGRGVQGYRPNFPQILSNGFDAWVRATNGKLGWTRVNNKSQADIVVGWTTACPELQGGTEAGRTKTFTKFDTSTNEGLIYRATMNLATKLPERELSDEEVTKTFMHEAGHAFGIAGHSPHRDDIMCAKVNHDQQPVLSARDVATIVRLYGTYPPCAQANLSGRNPSL